MGYGATGVQGDCGGLNASSTDVKAGGVAIGSGPAGVGDRERSDVVGRVGECDRASGVGDSEKCAGDDTSLGEVSAGGQRDGRALDTSRGDV